MMLGIGGRTRRASAGFAVLAMVALLGGCHAMPAGSGSRASPNRPQSTLASASRTALLPATVAMDPPSEMASIEPVATVPGFLTPAKPPTPAPTPLLDAAVQSEPRCSSQVTPKRAAADPAKSADQAAADPATIRVPSDPPASPNQIPLPPANPPRTLVASASPDPAQVERPEPSLDPEPARPEDLWRDGVRQLGSLARARVEQQSGGSEFGHSLEPEGSEPRPARRARYRP